MRLCVDRSNTSTMIKYKCYRQGPDGEADFITLEATNETINEVMRAYKSEHNLLQLSVVHWD